VTHKFVPNRYTRFLQKVDTHGFDPGVCWEWLGGDKENGYGNVNLDGTTQPAHRASYKLFVGEVSDAIDVCHTCDNPICCNPDHLFKASRQINMLDAKSKGRLRGGGGGKHLTKEVVSLILVQLQDGHSCRKVSIQMGIPYHRVYGIKVGTSYSKMTGIERVK